MIASLDVFAQEDRTLPMDKMIKSVAYLEGERPRVELINGLPHEIGFRKPGSKEFQLLTERVTGTGFFIREADRLFLVTAAHVARGLSVNVKLITSDASGNSKSYPLDRSMKWVFSEKADVAVSLIDSPLLISTFLETALEFSILPTSETSPVSELLKIGTHPIFIDKRYFGRQNTIYVKDSKSSCKGISPSYNPERE
jgi:hypothetical protein